MTESVPDQAASGWQAALDLRFEWRRGQGTVLAHARHQGPLRVQKPLYPEGRDICHAVLLHPPGGVAGGDQLQLDIAVAPGAHAVLTTPGATRWYKARGRPAAQQVRLQVADGALLEWLPQENMLFADVDATLGLDVELAPTARAIGWDAVVLGRYGAGEHWRQPGNARLALHNRIRCQGVPLWLEQGRLQAGDGLLDSRMGWDGFPIQASVWAVAPACNAALAEQLAALLPWSDTVRGGVSLLEGTTTVPPVLLLRLLARRMEVARATLQQAWQMLRPLLLQQEARALRLWAT